VPYGVPKIGNRFDKSVFYLYRTNPKTGVREGPLGTGFFTCRIGRPDSEETPQSRSTHYYGVTNHHVAIRDGASHIRINTTNGGVRFLPFETEDWHFKPGGDDICAVDIDHSNFQPDDEWDCIPEYIFLHKSEIERLDINLGENAFMVGLFVSHHGGNRNVPSARFGNVAMMASDNAPIKTEGDFNRPAHVIDMRSRSGFSGSPVFIYRTPVDDLTPPTNGWTLDTKKNLFMRFFGVHASQFQERVRVRRAPKLTSAEVDDEGSKLIDVSGEIREGDHLIMSSSMTIVVPSWRVSELLDLEVFEMARQKRDQDRRRQASQSEPLPALESDLPATDANPNHQEDFTRLVGAAARTRTQED
jgi:hypothetical protein